MAANRILYLISLIGTVFFFFASNIWVSWILLMMVIALPWISLLFSLPAILKCRLIAGLPEVTEVGEKVLLHIRIQAPKALPVPEVRVRLNLRTRDTNKDIRFLSKLSRTDGVLRVPTEVCGYLAPELIKGRVYDYLGLFAFPIRAPRMPVMAILPKALQMDTLPNMLQLMSLQFKPKLGGGYSEVHDHRPYRPGDPIKDIHWKLSLKTDELIVREPLEAVRRRVVLAVRTPRGPKNRTVTLGNLRYLSLWMLDHNITHTVAWMDGGNLRSAEVRDETGMIAAVAGTCLAAEDSKPLPKQLPYKTDWLCCVGGTEAGA